MSILRPPKTFVDTQSGRATWGRSVAVAVDRIITNLPTYLPLTGGTLTGDLIVPDEAYGVSWDGSLEVPTKNALYDKIETLGGGGGTTTNALTINNSGAGAASGATFNGSAAVTISYNTVGAAASAHTHAQADVTGLTTADSPQFTGINLGHASDTTLTRVSAGVVAIEGVNVVTTAGGVTFSSDISVPAEAYGTGWNGSNEAPTKNDVYDKIEANGKYLGRTAVSAAATADISLPSGYDSFYIEFYLAPGTDNVNFTAAITDDNFSTVESGASDYRYTQLRSSASSTGVTSSSGASSIAMIAGVGNSTNEFISGKIEVINSKETSATTIIFDFNYVTTAASYSQNRLMSDYVGTQAINGLRISVSSGTMTGFYKVWGRPT